MTEQPRIIEIIWERLATKPNVFYVAGDVDERSVDPVPRGPPRIIDLVMRMPYMNQMDILRKYVPKGANAFALGDVLRIDLGDGLYRQAVQFYRLSDEDWERAHGFEQRGFVFNGFFP